MVALAVGIAGLTALTAVTWAFHGTITGSLLGDAVSFQVRGVDVFAVAAVVVLGLVSIVDVQYLNVRERASELAALRAMGWSKAALGRLVAYEGAVAGLLGALSGAAAGMGATAWLAGSIPRLAGVGGGGRRRRWRRSCRYRGGGSGLAAGPDLADRPPRRRMKAGKARHTRAS